MKEASGPSLEGSWGAETGRRIMQDLREESCFRLEDSESGSHGIGAGVLGTLREDLISAQGLDFISWTWFPRLRTTERDS